MQHAGLQHRALRVQVLPGLLNAPVTQRKSTRLRSGLSWVRIPPGVLTIFLYGRVSYVYGLVSNRCFSREQKSAKDCLGRCASGLCGRSVSPVRAGSIPLRLAKLPGKPE